MSSLSLLPQVLTDGAMLGCVYAIVAVGLTLVFGVLRIVNFAHGDFLMVGLYASFVLAERLGWDPYLTIPLSLFAVLGTAWLAYRFCLEPLLNTEESRQVVSTLGISLIIQNGILLLFSGNMHAIPSRLGSSMLVVGGVFLRWPVVIAAVASVLLCAGLYWLLRSTDIGRQIRAAAEDRDAAQLCGLRIGRLYRVAFCLGVGTLGFVAPLIAPFYTVSPSIGGSFTLMSFVVVVLGGIGSFVGALVGGLVIGLVQAVAGLYTEGSTPLIFTYLIFVGVLLLRPTGIFGVQRA
jgi:branched-chain amino acid transport system permease protein